MKKIVIILVILMVGVDGFPKTPPWADKTSDKYFYYGVGMSFKKKAPKSHSKQTGEKYMNDYVEEARKKAIKNLAENISGVVVSGDYDNPDIIMENTRLRGLEVYEFKEYTVEYWVSVRIPKTIVEEMKKELKIENARKNLKEGKKEMKKSSFDEEFK